MEEPTLRMFENRVLRIFGTGRDDVTGECAELCNKELNGLYWTPNNVLVIVSRNMGLAGYVACRGRGEIPTGF